jgi:hypothetical protein
MTVLCDLTRLDPAEIWRALKYGDESLIQRLDDNGQLAPENKVPGISKWPNRKNKQKGLWG